MVKFVYWLRYGEPDLGPSSARTQRAAQSRIIFLKTCERPREPRPNQ